MQIRFGILTASDRSARGERPDASGPGRADLVRSQGWLVVWQAIHPDDRAALSEEMRSWCDGGEIDVILVTGGTGFAPRDVTPEATRDVIEREAPGLSEAMRAASLRVTPHAMLSRLVAGIRRKTLIINLPGSPRGAVENFQVVLPVLEHALHLLRGEDAGH
jgi:molybdenum cofactor synthesis domain-containing protein